MKNLQLKIVSNRPWVVSRFYQEKKNEDAQTKTKQI